MCGFRTHFLRGRSRQLRGPGALLGLTRVGCPQRELNVPTTGGLAAGARMPLAKLTRCRRVAQAAFTPVRSAGVGLYFIRDEPVFYGVNESAS